MDFKDRKNLHWKINAVFPFFKSKYLCKKGIHNYILNPDVIMIPHYTIEDDYENNMVRYKFVEYERIDKTNLKCKCCGKEIELRDN